MEGAEEVKRSRTTKKTWTLIWYADMNFLMKLQSFMSASYKTISSKSYKQTSVSFIVYPHLSPMPTHILTNIEKDEGSREFGDLDYFFLQVCFCVSNLRASLHKRRGYSFKIPDVRAMHAKQ